MARYYADWARGLGPDCTVAVGRWETAPAEAQGACALLPFPFEAAAAHRPWNLFRAARRIRGHLDAAPPRALVCGNIRPYGPLVARIAGRRGLPFVQVFHGNDLLRTARRWGAHPVKRRAWMRVAAGAARHVVNSLYTASLARELGLPGDRVAVVPPEVDTVAFRPPRDSGERDAARARYGWGPGERITLFAGRLVERKGLSDLLAALSGVPGVDRLVVAGPGDRSAYEREAQAAGVADRVTFLGYVTPAELPDLYRAVDLFAGPSRDAKARDDVEGFGIVYLEASASGLPVLATRAGGIPEAVEDGVGGLLVPPRDVPALSAAWARLAGDADLRRRLGDGGRGGRARTHGPGSSAAGLRAVIDEALHERNAR
jgi:phosphatidylinositol alpha-1,6-mannosyltransferase